MGSGEGLGLGLAYEYALRGFEQVSTAELLPGAVVLRQALNIAPNPNPNPNPNPDPNPNPNPNPNPSPNQAILHEHEVNSAPFSAQVLRYA